MHGRVNLEINPRQESLSTYLAQIRLLACVNAQMRIEITLADKHLVAHRARVLAIVRARVYLLMTLAEALGDETAATDLAHVRFYAEMTVFVV